MCSLEFYSCMDLKCPQMLCQKVELSESGMDFVAEVMASHSVDQITKRVVFLPGCLLVPSLHSDESCLLGVRILTVPRRMPLVGSESLLLIANKDVQDGLLGWFCIAVPHKL